MGDELGYEIKQRIRQEVQTILKPLFDEVARAVQEQTAQISNGKTQEPIEIIQRPLGTIRIERPTISKFAKMTIPDVNQWYRMVIFTKRVDTWSINNLDTTDLYYAYSNNASDYNTLAAGDFAAKDTRPNEIWVKRATSGNTVDVTIEWWEFGSDE